MTITYSSLYSTLNSGTTRAVLNIPGNMAFSKDLLVRANKGFLIFLRIKLGALLGPVHLLLFFYCDPHRELPLMLLEKGKMFCLRLFLL